MGPWRRTIPGTTLFKQPLKQLSETDLLRTLDLGYGSRQSGEEKTAIELLGYGLKPKTVLGVLS